jgi:two-component system nitrogen regulation response regulator GlnG
MDSPDPTIPEIIIKQMVPGSGRVLRLTVLYHPDAERIGEVADLFPAVGGGVAELGRTSTGFQAPCPGSTRRPLADPYLSRSPITIEYKQSGCEIRLPKQGSSLQIRGETVHDICRLSPGQIEAGQVLVLARRLVLLLHYFQSPDQEPPVQPGTQPSPDASLVGESWRLRQLRSGIAACAGSDSPVLLLGETGTGKELVARAIHEGSARAEAPWIAVNMAAIPAELASAELFGVRKGAFTGAERDKAGYFRQAHGGTLFLDEIGACAESVQPQLLRALQSGEIQVTGGEVTQVDVRIISATDAVIDGEEGQSFSAALRHRLGALELNLPPLRERREDIGCLMIHFFREAMVDGAGQLPGCNLDATVAGQWAILVARLAEYRWPGNVRELRNFCHQIAAASRAGTGLCVPDNILHALQRDVPAEHSCREASYRAAAELPEDEIIAAMESAGFEPKRAARLLNVSKTALYNRIDSIQSIRLVGAIADTEIIAIHKQSHGCLQRAVELHRVSRTSLLRRWRAMELTPRGS